VASKVESKFTYIILFMFYFLFLWGGQFSAALTARSISRINIYLLPLYGCFLGRAVVWLFILRGMDIIKAYTLTSLNYLIIPFLAGVFLGEEPGWNKFLGGLIIAGGIILYSVGEQRRRNAWLIS